MTTPTNLAGRPRPTTIDSPQSARVGLRAFPRHLKVLTSFACKIDDHFSCLIDACICPCHEGQR